MEKLASYGVLHPKGMALTFSLLLSVCIDLCLRSPANPLCPGLLQEKKWKQKKKTFNYTCIRYSFGKQGVWYGLQNMNGFAICWVNGSNWNKGWNVSWALQGLRPCNRTWTPLTNSLIQILQNYRVRCGIQWNEELKFAKIDSCLSLDLFTKFLKPSSMINLG